MALIPLAMTLLPAVDRRPLGDTPSSAALHPQRVPRRPSSIKLHTRYLTVEVHDSGPSFPFLFFIGSSCIAGMDIWLALSWEFYLRIITTCFSTGHYLGFSICIASLVGAQLHGHFIFIGCLPDYLLGVLRTWVMGEKWFFA